MLMTVANQSEKYLQNVIKQSGGTVGGMPPGNTPIQYANRQHQYYARRTTQFIKARAYLSSDFVQADVQGLIQDDFYKYLSTYIRLSDLVSQSATSTNTSAKNVDDIKIILFQEPSIDYFPVGAKVQTMGSTWICVNPSNISSVQGTATVQRCNAAYSLYDYYGNIVTEPIIVEKLVMSSNDISNPQNLVLMEGYFNVTCQLNDYTRELGQNQRIILGSKAYYITGFTDFIQEFTGDYDSVHLLRFTIRIEEPTVADDLVNHIANGNNYTFEASITGPTEVRQGAAITLNPHFIKNGTEVEPTQEYPLTWRWVSSNPDIATVDENGAVTGIGSGTVQITAILEQADGIIAMSDIVVTEAVLEPYVAFTGVIPQSINQYSSAQIVAGYFENGTLTDDAVTWSFSGANTGSYYTSAEGNTLTINCLRADRTPLVVTASYGEYSVSTSIRLEGY